MAVCFIICFKTVSLLFQRTILRLHDHCVAVKKMKAIKIALVLAATVAISLLAIGGAHGYYINNQTGINSNAFRTTNNGFWGWMRGCLGFGPRQTYGYQYQPPNNSTTQPPTNLPPQQPYQPQNPNQGSYQYGYGCGCWGW